MNGIGRGAAEVASSKGRSATRAALRCISTLDSVLLSSIYE